MKSKIIIFIMLVTFTGAVNALTVFNIDINGEPYGPNSPENLHPFGAYDGNAPAGAFDDGINRWNVYIGGWPIRMVPTSIPAGANWQLSKVYVGWDYDIGGFALHGDPNFTLFNDYAYKTGPNSPTLSIIGGADPDTGINYSQGAYNLYLYANDASQYAIEALHPDGSDASTVVNLPGTDPNDPNYLSNTNYAIVENLDSSTWINITIDSGQLAGLQLVDRGIKVPVVDPLPGDTRAGTDFSTAWASFAYDISHIGTGPFVVEWTDGIPPVTRNLLAQTYPGEWLVYDMYVEEVNEAGFYEINCAYCTMLDGVQVGFQIDDGPTAVVDISNTGTWGWPNGWSDFAQGRLYLSQGYHRLKVSIIGGGVNIWGFRIRRADNQSVVTCLDAQMAGYALNDMDFDGDCIVNLVDLARFAANWLDCTNPAGCP